MRFTLRLTAALVLFGWLFAIGHLAVEHGAIAFAAVDHELIGHDDDHHDDDPEHHHHDLSVLPPGPLTKATDEDALAPVWISLHDELAASLTRLQRDSSQSHRNACFGNAAPDARASGWLLVCRTARPVRGPSVVL
ncbi:MAG: hypothetical protein ABMA01_14535 [Chthoniobacteraceae bacterium]